MRLRRFILALVAAVALCSSSEYAGLPETAGAPSWPNPGAPSEPLAIVVNRSNPVNELSSSELRDVFLGNRGVWPNGRRITLVMRNPEEPERQTILREVCGMTEQQFRTHFVRGLYTGEILVSPKILSSVNGVRRFIFNVPGAIGYLRLSDVDSSVKELRIDETLPEDRGYKLRVPVRAVE